MFVDALGQSHAPYVAGGLLHSQGYHTRIDSIPAFAPMGQSVVARARISLGGDYHQFGFGVNPNERAGPITGYYFDTYNRFDTSMGREDYVHALAWFQPAVGSPINLLDVEIPVTWYEFHEFAIERTPSEVIYLIDGQEVARVADAFAGALPVGVWNARWDLMQTDWVEVSQVPEPAIEATVDIDPDVLNLQSKGKWITAYITLPADVNVTDVNANTVLLNGTIKAEWTWAEEEDQLMMAKFSRSAVQAILQPGQVELTVSGKLNNGTMFEGKDTITVINEGKP